MSWPLFWPSPSNACRRYALSLNPLNRLRLIDLLPPQNRAFMDTYAVDRRRRQRWRVALSGKFSSFSR